MIDVDALPNTCGAAGISPSVDLILKCELAERKLHQFVVVEVAAILEEMIATVVQARCMDGWSAEPSAFLHWEGEGSICTKLKI